MDIETRQAIRFSVVINLVIFITLVGLPYCSGCLSTNKDDVTPMEFIVVTEENAADRLAEEPNEAVEPEPEPEPEPIPTPPTPDPEPEPLPPPPPIPDPDPIPIKEKPAKPVEKKPTPPKEEKKKVEKKPDAPKEKPKEKPQPKPKPIIKTGTRVGPVTQGKKDVRKAATQKAMSAAEIEKWLKAGARSGNVNQKPSSDAARCYGIIQRTFHDAMNDVGLEESPTGRAPVLSVKFGTRGSIVSISIGTSSGDAGYDSRLLSIARKIRRVDGLSDSFLRDFKTVQIRMSVTE